MSTSSEKFSTVLADVEATVKIKIEAFPISEATDQSELNGVILFAKEAAIPFLNSKLRLIEFDFDEAKIRSAAMKFSSADIQTMDAFKTKITELAGVIMAAGLKEAIDKAEAVPTSVINERILNAVQLTARSITRAIKSFFTDQNLDLRTDDQFKELFPKQLETRAKYRDALKNETITGVEGDVIFLNNQEKFYNSVKETNDFLLELDHLTTFMDGKLKEASTPTA